MKRLHLLQKLAVALTCAGTLLPQSVLAAGKSTLANAESEPQHTVVDVALSNGGVLRGQVVTTAGSAQTDERVTVAQEGKLVRQATTDADGRFTVTGLKGGTYAVATAKGAGVVRVWAEGTAPPTAKSQLLVVHGDTVVRGQAGVPQIFGGVGHGGLLMLGVAGGIVGAGVAKQANYPGS